MRIRVYLPKIDNFISRLITCSALGLIGLFCLIAAFARTEQKPAPRLLLPRPATAPAMVETTEAAAAHPNWIVRSHGECCEGNLAAAGNNTFVLLPILVTGNKILKSADGGSTWTEKYPPAPASVPFGIEGDMQAWGTDVIFFGTELGVMVTAHSDDYGETFIPVQNPVASAGNDQAWSYLGPFGDLRPGGALATDEPYVLAGWMRIGSALVFSFDGGLTYPLQTPLVGDNGSGSEHIVCQQNAHAPTSPGDTRIANQDFRNHKSGRYGAWGTDRKFYWAEPSIAGVQGGDGELFVCKTDNFGATWTGVRHPISPGAGQDFVVAHTAFDNNGTLYVLHGDQLYVSFNQGESFAFVHTLPRYGSVRLSDPGSDQFFVVNCGTIHIALAESGASGTNMWYLRGSRVDTATPVWDEELVETVGSNRLDFIQIVVNGNNIPTISYTKPGAEVTTASRVAPMPPNGPDSCTVSPVSIVSRKAHAGTGTFDINLPLIGTRGVECRSPGQTGTPGVDYKVVFTFLNNITNCGTTSTAGGSVVSGPNANQCTVNLTGIPDGQYTTVSLTGVTDVLGNSGNGAPQMGLLVGDVNGSGVVTSGDTNLCKAHALQPVTASNFRMDINASGEITTGDVNVIKQNGLTQLP